MLAIGSVILGLLVLSGAGYVYLTPGVEEQPPQEIDSFEIETTLTDSAVVEAETPLYERGERIQSKPAYFLNVTPNLQLSAVVEATDDRNITINQRLVLREQALRNDAELWSRERVLATNEMIVSDGTARTNASVDVVDLSVRLNEIASVIESVSTPSTQLRLETAYETEPVAGESYEGELVVVVDLNFATNAYWLDGERTASNAERQMTQQEPIQQSPNMALVLVLAVVGGGLVVTGGVIVRKSSELDPHELQIEVFNKEYGEWISKGELVVDPDRQYVYVNSLEDLVNIGIDADKRVIHDTELQAYVVVDSGLIYYFARDPTNIELWANVGGSSNVDQS